ncbi:MAG: hypothetical protein FGM55_03220 [Rhodoferax sp.]|nr:hypothetical protein [Rhodoferax sp.]
MPPFSRFLSAPLLLAASGIALAQPAPSPARTDAASVPGPAPVEARAVRIRIEDAGSRIDELRVGGETRSITVQPKGGMPAYQVQPSSGERRWKVLAF